MATPYYVKTTTPKAKSVKKGSWFSRHKVLLIFLALIISLTAWINSDFWPWPWEARINDRLDLVVEVCNGNENGKYCKELQRKYNITFRYCQSKYAFSKKQMWLGDKLIDVPYAPWYAVAWQGKSSMPPEKKSTSKYQLLDLDAYSKCQDHQPE